MTVFGRRDRRLAMRYAGAVGGRGRVAFSPAMVAGRPGSGAGRAWLRAHATAGPSAPRAARRSSRNSAPAPGATVRGERMLRFRGEGEGEPCASRPRPVGPVRLEAHRREPGVHGRQRLTTSNGSAPRVRRQADEDGLRHDQGLRRMRAPRRGRPGLSPSGAASSARR